MSDVAVWLMLGGMLLLGALGGVGVALDRFACGAFAAALAAVIGVDAPTQLWWFFAISAAALFLARRLRRGAR